MILKLKKDNKNDLHEERTSHNRNQTNGIINKDNHVIG